MNLLKRSRHEILNVPNGNLWFFVGVEQIEVAVVTSQEPQTVPLTKCAHRIPMHAVCYSLLL